MIRRYAFKSVNKSELEDRYLTFSADRKYGQRQQQWIMTVMNLEVMMVYAHKTRSYITARCTFDNLLFGGDAVVATTVDRGQVMNVYGVDALDFESGGLELVDHPYNKWMDGCQEGIFDHKSPQMRSSLSYERRMAATGDESAVLAEEMLHLVDEGSATTDADVLKGN